MEIEHDTTCVVDVESADLKIYVKICNIATLDDKKSRQTVRFAGTEGQS
jgi:hypothetical protein